MTHPSPSAGTAFSLPPPRSRPRRSRSLSHQLPPSAAAGWAPVRGPGTRVHHPSSMTLGAGGCPGLHRGGPPGSPGPLPRHSGTPRAPGLGALGRAEVGRSYFILCQVALTPGPFYCFYWTECPAPGRVLLISNPQLRLDLLQEAFPEPLRPGEVAPLFSHGTFSVHYH